MSLKSDLERLGEANTHVPNYFRDLAVGHLDANNCSRSPGSHFARHTTPGTLRPAHFAWRALPGTLRPGHVSPGSRLAQVTFRPWVTFRPDKFCHIRSVGLHSIVADPIAIESQESHIQKRSYTQGV